MTSESKTNSSLKSARIKIIKTIVDFVFVAFCAGLSTFYLYIGNITELRFRETALPLLIFSAVGWILYVILRLALKAPQKAAVLSGVAMAVITNAGLLRDALGYAVVLIISAVLIVAVFFIFIRFFKNSFIEKTEYILTAIIAGLILFNVAVSLPKLSETKRLADEAQVKAESLEEINLPSKIAGADVELPNFYIFIFDELAGTQCMSEVFGYDNTGFYDDMRTLGFTVSGDCTNYRQFTYEALSGLFNLDYAFSYETYGAFACEERFKNARFFDIMEEIGYSLYETEVAGLIEFEPRIEYGTSKEYHTTEDGLTTHEVIYGKTLLEPVMDAFGVFPSNYDLYNEVLNYYTLSENYVYKNALTFSYICCPHAPFLYDINGDPVDKEDSMNWKDSKFFTQQYEYICGRITETMKSVIENDPDSIILVLSDHGVKSNKHLWDGPETTFEQSVDTFFAVYTGGRNDIADITGLSGANVLRTVLNEEYGFELGMAGPPENLRKALRLPVQEDCLL